MTPGRAFDDEIKRARSYFDAWRRALARAYRPYRYFSLIASLLFDFAFFWLIILSPAGRALEAAPPSHFLPAWRAAIWAASTFILRSALATPLSYLTGYLWPKKFGLVVHSPVQYFKDLLVSVAVSLPVAAGGAALLEWLILARPGSWWLYASVLAGAFTIIVTALAPVLLMPLFNRFVPMQDGGLKRALLEMADRAGIRVTDVYVMDMSRRTTTANAMLTGLGPTRRMIVGDTLLADFPEDEVQVVMAHELAHHYHKHITWGLALSALALPPIFYLALQIMGIASRLAGPGPGTMRYLGVFVAVLYLASLLSSPVSSRLSRFFEWQSDDFALRMTGLGGAMARMMARLTDGSLGDIDPPALVKFFFYTHPPALERIVHALRFMASGASPPGAGAVAHQAPGPRPTSESSRPRGIC
ncbi:MAG: M48 family metallopeptidase [Bacillota bacterium]|nr:M48 family metallopeptidase [Bacillota bacterium]